VQVCVSLLLAVTRCFGIWVVGTRLELRCWPGACRPWALVPGSMASWVSILDLSELMDPLTRVAVDPAELPLHERDEAVRSDQMPQSV
jgi:hypothetical protein